MIRSIQHKALKRFFEKGDTRLLDDRDVPKVRRILAQLNIAVQPQDMGVPDFHLHPLKGDRQGQWAVTVRANWRIVFRFEAGNVEGVDLVDYHGK